MARDNDQRTQRPTSARRREARRLGQVPQSPDLVAALSLLFTFLALRYVCKPFVEGGVSSFTDLILLCGRSAPIQQEDAVQLGGMVARGTLFTVVPVATIAVAVAIGAGLVQTGALLQPRLALPDAGRLSPAGGFGRVFSLRGATRAAFALLKYGALAGVLVWAMRPFFEVVGPLSGSAMAGAPLDEALGAGLDHLAGVGIAGASLLAVLGCLNWVAERWLHERELQMTPREVREEVERQEGRRDVKRRRRQLARDLLGASRGPESAIDERRGGVR